MAAHRHLAILHQAVRTPARSTALFSYTWNAADDSVSLNIHLVVFFQSRSKFWFSSCIAESMCGTTSISALQTTGRERERETQRERAGVAFFLHLSPLTPTVRPSASSSSPIMQCFFLLRTLIDILMHKSIKTGAPRWAVNGYRISRLKGCGEWCLCPCHPSLRDGQACPMLHSHPARPPPATR